MAVNKDWTGNSNSIYKTIGASNHTTEDRQNEDYYATPSNVTEMLWNLEDFSETIVEPACGEGHIAEVFKAHKHKVIATDLIDRGYGTGGIDFFDMHLPMDADIVTNPPYSMAKEFVEHAMELVTDGHKVAMLLKLTFLEGQKRKKLFEKYPPKTIYVSTTRIGCFKMGSLSMTRMEILKWIQPFVMHGLFGKRAFMEIQELNGLIKGASVNETFVVSDTHSYFDEMIKALNEAGFDKENPNHMLIHCGDTVDRGPKPAEMIDYLTALPNKVLVRGNHETLMLNMIQRGFPHSNDFHNGTYQTVLDLAPNTESFTKACSVAYSKMKPMLDIMVDYFETQHYIFTHGYIPCWGDWRYASYDEWEEARWLNGFDESKFHTVEGKQIVVGHWHCSYANHQAYGTPEWGEGANFEPYIDNDIICIDACTAYTKKVNVLVLEDNLI